MECYTNVSGVRSVRVYVKQEWIVRDTAALGGYSAFAALLHFLWDGSKLMEPLKSALDLALVFALKKSRGLDVGLDEDAVLLEDALRCRCIRDGSTSGMLARIANRERTR